MKLLSQYESIGLVQQLKKLKDDVLQATKDQELDDNNEEIKLPIEEPPKQKSILREMVEKEYPQVNERPIEKLREWEVPIVKRLVKKHNNDYKVRLCNIARECLGI